ncbi:hypothetical protein [Nocardia wallacei]|uniref:hypothetical protein n=1 Tax=Nocardia wallacei TaxID=480035 RepID=UPI0024556990|nr:hypothetical protein [Nocardia wallacei]
MTSSHQDQPESVPAQAGDPAAARLAAAAAGGPSLLLWSAAMRTAFTVCRHDRRTVWHAPFHPHVTVDGDTDSATLAALQAIWLAARARAHHTTGPATLRLLTATDGLDEPMLTRAALGDGLLLVLDTVPIGNAATEHPHGEWIDWHTTDLAALLQPPEIPT